MNNEAKFRMETKQIGNCIVEKTPEGNISKINNIEISPNDAIIVVQRHQKPAPFPKEDLLASAKDIPNPKNLDYVYNPKSTAAGAQHEQLLLQKVKEAFGKMDFVATTPRQRGTDHKQLIKEVFPEAQENAEAGKKLDDSGLGLLGESQFGAETYSPKETSQLFEGSGHKAANFGIKKSESESRKALTYMESWVQHGNLPDNNKWRVENPEEFCKQISALAGQAEGKNFFITHEANILAMRMLAERTSQEISTVLNQLSDIPAPALEQVTGQIHNIKNFLALYQEIRKILDRRYKDTDIPAKERGYNSTKILAELLEKIKLKSGAGNRGYAALSAYVIKTDKTGRKHILEAMYDQQVFEA